MELLALSVKVVFVVTPHLFPLVAYILSVICRIQNGLRMWNSHHIVVKSSINLRRHCLVAAEGGFLVWGILSGWASLWGAGKGERIHKGVWAGTWLLSEFEYVKRWCWNHLKLVDCDCSFLLYSSCTYRPYIPCHFPSVLCQTDSVASGRNSVEITSHAAKVSADNMVPWK